MVIVVLSEDLSGQDSGGLFVESSLSVSLDRSLSWSSSSVVVSLHMRNWDVAGSVGSGGVGGDWGIGVSSSSLLDGCGHWGSIGVGSSSLSGGGGSWSLSMDGLDWSLGSSGSNCSLRIGVSGSHWSRSSDTLNVVGWILVIVIVHL